MHKHFLTTYRYTKGKIHRKLCNLQKNDLYLNQFSNKKGAIGKPERPKRHPIWAAHPRTHLSTKYPPGVTYKKIKHRKVNVKKNLTTLPYFACCFSVHLNEHQFFLFPDITVSIHLNLNFVNCCNVLKIQLWTIWVNFCFMLVKRERDVFSSVDVWYYL